MADIETSKLNRSLSSVLGQVAAGETINLTRYGKVVAHIVPPGGATGSIATSYNAGPNPPVQVTQPERLATGDEVTITPDEITTTSSGPGSSKTVSAKRTMVDVTPESKPSNWAARNPEQAARDNLLRNMQPKKR